MFKSLIQVFALLAFFAFSLHNCFPTNEIDDSNVKTNTLENCENVEEFIAINLIKLNFPLQQ